MAERDRIYEVDHGMSMGFDYGPGAEGVEPITPNHWDKSVKDFSAPSVERLVRQTQAFLSVGIDPSKIGDPMESLNPEQLAAYHDDKRFRGDLVRSSGGEVGVWEGLEEAEANDPYMQSLMIAHEARVRSERALTALLVYEASPEVRVAYRLYEWRREATMAVRRFWTWLRR